MKAASLTPEEFRKQTLSPEEIEGRVRDFIDSHRDVLIADSARLVQFQTVSGGNPEQQKIYEKEIPAAFEWLNSRAAAMGFGFRVIQGIVGEISWAHPDPEAPVVVVAVHIDVVTPVGEWQEGPFSGKVDDKNVWGRGMQDDKGPLIQVLHGMWALKSSGIQPPCSINIAIGTMEETSRWDDMYAYIDDAGVPDFAFTPDANFPIINGEKGMTSIAYEADWKTGADPATGMEFVSLIGGERENIVPSLAELTIRFPLSQKDAVLKELIRSTTEYVVEHNQANVTLLPHRERIVDGDRYEATVSFLGRAAHSSTPEKGHNAILDALDFIKDLESFPLPVRQYATFVYIAASDLGGANLNLDVTHPFIGPTTVSLSLIEMTDAKARSLINVRPTMGLTTDEVLKRCTESSDQFTKSVGLKLRISRKASPKNAIYLDPATPALAPYLKCLQRGFELVTGLPGELKATAGTTYSKAIPNCCAFGPLLAPVDEELLHKSNERMLIESIIRNAKIYGTSLGMLAAQER